MTVAAPRRKLIAQPLESDETPNSLTFAHSGPIVDDKGGNIFFIGHG